MSCTAGKQVSLRTSGRWRLFYQRCPRRQMSTRLTASTEASAPPVQVEPMEYKHLLVALFDANAYLSDASRQAVATTASLAGQHSSKVTVLFVDEEGKEVEGKARIEQIEAALQRVGCQEVDFIEKASPAATVGQGSVAVGDVADELDADLVVMSTSAVHEKHVDANLLAEFVPCPVLLLP